MKTFKKVFMSVSLISTIMFISTSFAKNGDTLYVLNHAPTFRYLYAFKINGNNLDYQTKITLPNYGIGPVNIAIDNESEVLFVAYENGSSGGGNIIELVDARTMELLGPRDLQISSIIGPVNITGLAYDAARNRLYVTDRNKQEIFVYDYDPAYRTFEPVPQNPIELTDMTYDRGLCFGH